MALQNPSPSTPFARYGDVQLRALRLLQNIFQQALPPTFSKHTQPFDKTNLDFQALVKQEATTLAQQYIQALRYQEQKQLQSVPVPSPLTLLPPSLPVISQDIDHNVSETPIVNEPVSPIARHDPIIVKFEDPKNNTIIQSLSQLRIQG